MAVARLHDVAEARAPLLAERLVLARRVQRLRQRSVDAPGWYMPRWYVPRWYMPGCVDASLRAQYIPGLLPRPHWGSGVLKRLSDVYHSWHICRSMYSLVDAPEQLCRHVRSEDAVDSHDAVGSERVRDGEASLCSRSRRADGRWPVRSGGGGGGGHAR